MKTIDAMEDLRAYLDRQEMSYALMPDTNWLMHQITLPKEDAADELKFTFGCEFISIDEERSDYIWLNAMLFGPGIICKKPNDIVTVDFVNYFLNPRMNSRFYTSDPANGDPRQLLCTRYELVNKRQIGVQTLTVLREMALALNAAFNDPEFHTAFDELFTVIDPFDQI